MVHPLLQELQPLQDVSNVAAQRLQAWVGALGPVVWNLGEGGGGGGGSVRVTYQHLQPV